MEVGGAYIDAAWERQAIRQGADGIARPGTDALNYNDFTKMNPL
jgi:hypothetical protein